MMNTIKKNLLILALLSTVFVACRKGLATLPAYKDCNVAALKFEIRWEQSIKRFVGDPLQGGYKEWFENVVFFRPVVSISNTVSSDTVYAKLPTIVADTIAVKTNTIVVMANISVGAIIRPLDGSPTLGSIGDFSVPRTYEVTAADGITKKTWVFVVNQ